MAATYPGGAKSFTTKTNGQTIDPAHVNDLQDEVTAVEQDLIAGLPVARGGTGNTSAGTSGQALVSDGTKFTPTTVALGTPTEQTTTATGTQNNFNLSARYTYLRCTGAAPRFTGFTVAGSAPQAGDTVVLAFLGTTGRVDHESGASTVANRVITPSTQGQICGANGMITLVYDTTTDRWRMRDVEPGKPIAVEFSAGNFTGNGSMTWTVESADQETFTYQQRGKTVKIWLSVNTTTIGGTPSTTLMVALPNSFVSSVLTYMPVSVVVDAGTAALGVAVTGAGGTLLAFNRADGGSFSAATNTTVIRAVVELEVN